jgi:hypothetical protein
MTMTCEGQDQGDMESHHDRSLQPAIPERSASTAARYGESISAMIGGTLGNVTDGHLRPEVSIVLVSRRDDSAGRPLVEHGHDELKRMAHADSRTNPLRALSFHSWTPPQEVRHAHPPPLIDGGIAHR